MAWSPSDSEEEKKVLPRETDWIAQQQLADVRLLDQVAAGARPQRLDDLLVLFVPREDQDPRVGAALADLPGGVQPVEPRHHDVHQHDVRLHALGRRRRLPPVGHVAQDVQFGVALQQQA